MIVKGSNSFRTPVRRLTIRPLRDFLAAEASGGVAVLLATGIALAWANSPWVGSYLTLWSTEFGAHIGRYGFSLDLRHWVNDGLMTVFFLVVGLEIKRELVEGELRERRKALVPVVAAIGGMAVPALIFVAWTIGTPQISGWGIPMATDIAPAGNLGPATARMPTARASSAAPNDNSSVAGSRSLISVDTLRPWRSERPKSPLMAFNAKW